MKAEREIQVNRKESREYEIIKKMYKKWEKKHRRQESRNKEQ